MKKSLILCLITSFILLMVQCAQKAIPVDKKMPTLSPLAQARSKYVQQVLAQIKGREKMAVDSVFKNLKVLGGFPAENLVVAMERWSEALGVSCDHCHVVQEWHQDVKPEKDIARQMVNMGEEINTTLRKMKGLESEKPGVNCYSCHRGALKPARRPQ